jgi:3-hydroxyisobutyrate dehydrogenase
MKVGFIGLGRMGQGMARNLLKAGVPLLVYDANPAAAAAIGAEVADTVSALTKEAGVIFTSLPGPIEIEAVVLGTGGVLEDIRSDSTLFDLSTSSLSLARRLDTAFRQKGGWFLDAPISGGPAGAASGDLAIWVGGERAVYDRHLPLLKAMADKPRHVGPIGAGTVTKLAHNVLGYMIMQSLAEVFSVAVKADVDPVELWEALWLGVVGKSSPLDMLVKQFLPGKYEPAAFALRLAHKDVTLATALGRELGVPMQMANLTFAEMSEAVGRGWGEHDSRSFLKLQLERAGVEIAADPDRLARAIKAVKG